MSARAEQNSTGTAVGCLILLIGAWLVIGCVVYVAGYGEPQGFSLTLIIVLVLWPAALVWWSLKWLAIAFALLLACYGAKRAWEEL